MFKGDRRFYAGKLARLSVGQWTAQDERKAAVPPFYLVTTADAANAVANLPDGWPGPNGFKDKFKQLWGV